MAKSNSLQKWVYQYVVLVAVEHVVLGGKEAGTLAVGVLLEDLIHEAVSLLLL